MERRDRVPTHAELTRPMTVTMMRKGAAVVADRDELPDDWRDFLRSEDLYRDPPDLRPPEERKDLTTLWLELNDGLADPDTGLHRGGGYVDLDAIHAAVKRCAEPLDLTPEEARTFEWRLVHDELVLVQSAADERDRLYALPSYLERHNAAERSTPAPESSIDLDELRWRRAMEPEPDRGPERDMGWER